ncbi:MAG: gliding motility-associated C-terminal domain-containing protein [Chitinophagaceae bacterium]
MSWLRIIYLLTVLLLTSRLAFADTFLVTNVNNAGTGSLRDAINLANNNGTLTLDFILFNIPSSIRDKTIYIRPFDLLPALTSNITIDGTTQPGSNLGASTSKVTIAIEGTPIASGNPIVCFNLSQASNITIYSLFIKALVVDRNTLLSPESLYGIYMEDSHNIEIGDIGKGNVLTGWNKAIFNKFDGRLGNSSSISIKANFFGLETDGVSIDYSGRTGGKATNISGIYIEEARSIEVGGTTDRESNYFNSGFIDVFIQGEYDAGTDGSIKVINNKFGIAINGTNLNSNTFTGIRLSHLSNWLSGFPPILISRNYIGGTTRAIGIQVDSILPRFRIEENMLGFEENGQRPRNSNYGIGILVNECENGLIGANNPLLANTIRYWNGGAITCDSTRDISIFQNTTYCNSKRSIKLLHWYDWNSAARIQPFVTINQIDNIFGVVSGKALPLSTIELFYDDDCPGCEGKTFFARTTSNAVGNWIYRGPVGRGNIIATASDRGNATSEYSEPQIDSSNKLSSAIFCNGQLASICGIKIISGTNWQWENSSGTIVGTDTCLRGINAGLYRLRLSIGSQSCEEVFTFNVLDSLLAIDSSQGVTITNSRCGKMNGFIKGMKAVNADRWQWEDRNGMIVGTDLELRNVAVGIYRFRIFNRFCSSVSDFYTITNITPAIDINSVIINATTCNLSNGSIKGILISGASNAIISWIDQYRTVVGNSKELINRNAGQYKLIVADTAAGCADSTNYFTINALPAPTLDTLNAVITHTTCDSKNGSIFNLSTTGTIPPLLFVWVDEQNKIVGNSLSLSNVQAGRYRLKIKDASSCDTILSNPFEILNNGSIGLDTSLVIINPTGCTKTNGSITGIKLTGANNIQWINTSTNRIVSSSMDLTDMPAGTYQLTASNSLYRCTKQTNLYTIGTALPETLNVLQSSTKDATCNLDNGSIEINQLSKSSSLFLFTWLKDSITNIGGTLLQQGLSPASYFLIATDTNGCSQQIYKRTITRLPLPVLNETTVLLKNDTCAFGTGSINGITASSSQGNLTYKWLNHNNELIGTAKNLNKLKAGNYQLTITDINGCQLKSSNYSLNETVISIATPLYDLLTIPRYSSAILKIKNPVAGALYELFEATSGLLVQSNHSGIFEIKNVREDVRFIVKGSGGLCRSEPGTAILKVVDLTQVDIPTAFSPNGDGINDKLRIRVIGYFRSDAFKIFNRWGQLVYETKDLGNEWGGTIKGKPLPMGTYYWMIEGLDVHNKRFLKSGSVTLIR